MEKKIRYESKNILIITTGAMIYAIGISLFLNPNNLAPGGITGIAVILNHILGIEIGTMYFILNIPIVFLGIWKFGFCFIAKTAYAVTVISIFTNFLADVRVWTEDLILAGIVGGGLIAVGIGLIFKAGATTGGTDIIVKLLRKKYKHLKTSILFLYIDIMIVSISGIVFKNLDIIFYALVTVIASGKVLDYVLYGGDEAKIFYIMTEKHQEIGKRLLKELGVGVTYLHGSGGWTGKEKQVVLSMVQKRIGPQVREIVKMEDPCAFMVIASANEIYGEGYKDIYADIA